MSIVNNNINLLSYSELNERLKKLKQERKDYLEGKSVTLRKLIETREKEIEASREIVTEKDKLIDNLKEIDQHVFGLEQIITTSVNIAFSIINPIKEREKCITNIQSTLDLLEIENHIKHLLNDLKHEKSKIENKINIILKANILIKTNPSVFDFYRENFMKESQDVLNFLKHSFEEMKKKILNNAENNTNLKECNNLLAEMDKNSILTYKLTNDITVMENFFNVMSNFVIKAICRNKLIDFNESLKEINLNSNKIKEINETVKTFIRKIFLKVASIINERKQLYSKEFNDHKIFNLLIEKVLNFIESCVENLVVIITNLSDKITKDNSSINSLASSNDLDFLCGELITIIENFEKFKFFVSILLEKNILTLNTRTNSAQLNNFSEIFRKYNTLQYDLGEKYGNAEIKFMQSKLLLLFKEESKTFNAVLEKNINSKFEEIAQSTLLSTDDFFYILKVSGRRAIGSLNLQMSLAIINNIKGILSEDLLKLLDLKISAVLVKTENKNIQYNEIKYQCREEPTISYKNMFGNLFLIACLNSIDQSKNNISLLMEELKNSIHSEIINSQAFNHREIVLGIDQTEEEKINQSLSYFNQNEIELINITFSDVDALINKYEAFLNKKMKLAFEFMYMNIKSSVDLLNSVNYFLDGRNIINAELSESFSGKFIEETEKILRQWKSQMSEGSFNKFLGFYADYVGVCIERLLMLKNFTTYGVILLEKVRGFL